MDVTRPTLDEGNSGHTPGASLKMNGGVADSSLQLIFTMEALSPTGVSLLLILEGRWESPEFEDWQQAQVEQFVEEHAAAEAFTRIDQALDFFAEKFGTQVPIFSRASLKLSDGN